MGINASKTVVTSKEKKEEVKEVKQNKEEPEKDSSWRAEKDGKKSSFLQDMLS